VAVSPAFRVTTPRARSCATRDGGADVAERPSEGPRLIATTCALGVAQIVSWGTLFYSIGVLAAPIRAELDVGDVTLFGGYTAGLVVSGVASPWVGRRIDAFGGRAVLAIGSVLAAVALAVLALARGPISLTFGWLLAGAAMAATLYDPAFAALSQIAGTSYRRAVTLLTLFGGFASTVFWPLSQLLHEHVGWRSAFGWFAVLHLVLCLPLHVIYLPRGGGRGATGARTQAGEWVSAAAVRAYFWLAAALALASLMASGVAAHLIGLLTAKGLTAGQAVIVGALIGPMQVAGRIVEFAFARRFRPLAVGTFAFALLASSMVVFTQVSANLAIAIAFAALYGWSNGVMTIVRGVVPAELFGRRGYGALLGRLAMPQLVARAIAPLALAAFFAIDADRTHAPWVLLGCAVLALGAYQLAIRAASGAR